MSGDCAVLGGVHFQNGTLEMGNARVKNINYNDTFTIFCGLDWPGNGPNGDNNNESTDCDNMLACLDKCVAWNYNNEPSRSDRCVGVTFVPDYTASQGSRCYNKKSMNGPGIAASSSQVDSAKLLNTPVRTIH